MLQATVKDLLAHRRRVAATAVAVVLGVAFLAGTLVLTDTVRATVRDLYTDVYAGTDSYVRPEPAFSSYRGPQRPGLDASLVDTVAAVDGVAAAEGRVEGYAQLLDRRGRALRPPGGPGSDLHGFLGARPDSALHGTAWSDHDDLNPFRLVAGRAPQEDSEVVIDRRSARAAGYGAGDRVTVLLPGGPREVEIVGIAAFGRADSPGGSSYVFFTPGAARRLLGTPDKVDAVAVAAAPGVGAEDLRDRVAAVVPPGVEVLTGAQAGREGQERSRGVTAAVGTFLLAFALVALFVGAFIIHNTFTILVAQRSRDVALLRAIGASRRQVLASVLLEALLVGVAGSALGLVAGAGVAAALKSLLSVFGLGLPGGTVVVTPGALLASGTAGLVVTVLSAILPARRAAGVPPVAALREVAADTSAASVRRVAFGLALIGLGTAGVLIGMFSGRGDIAPVGLGAAVVFVGVAALGPVTARPLVRLLGAPIRSLGGVPGTLAVEDAARNPRRTSGAAAALMIGVGLVSFIGIFASSARASLARSGAGGAQGSAAVASIAVDPLAHGVGGVSPEMARRIAELPEVAEASGVRMGIAAVEGDASRDVVAVDPAVYERLADPGVIEGDLGGLGGDGIAVAEPVARERGWSVGHSLRVRFADSGERLLRVSAVYTRGPGSYLVSRPLYEASVADQFDVRVLVKPAPGVDGAEVRRAIETVTGQYGIPTLEQTPAEGTAGAGGSDQTLGMVYVLLALAVVIALLGITNTLSLSVLERTRELGLLRAVGMSRTQLRSMVRYQSVLIALYGALLGMVVGLFFAWAMTLAVPEGFHVRLHVPVGQLAVMAGVAAAAALLAAGPPARRAAKLDVLAAVGHQ